MCNIYMAGMSHKVAEIAIRGKFFILHLIDKKNFFIFSYTCKNSFFVNKDGLNMKKEQKNVYGCFVALLAFIMAVPAVVLA